MSLFRSPLIAALVWTVLLAGCLPDSGDINPDPPESITDPIVGGAPVTTCMWPSCVSAGGCTNTLIHPKIVTTARHCLGSTPRSITFGETRMGGVRTVNIQSCVRHPTSDVGFCVLATEVTDVPIVPVLAACEARDMIKNGQPAVLVGYGNLRSGMSSGGRKHAVQLMINSLSANGTEVNLGTPQLGACNGDSGGPAYLKMPDGTWRAFGVTSRKGPGGSNCASSTIYGLLSAHIAWIERESGLDITPCHGPNGWEGGPACDKFPTDPGGAGVGTWANMCAEQPVAKPMQTCMGFVPPIGDGGVVPPVDARPDVASDRPDARVDGRVDAAAEAAPATPDATSSSDTASPDTGAPYTPPDASAPEASSSSPEVLPPAGRDAGAPPPGAKPGVTAEGCGCAINGKDAHPVGVLFVGALLLFAIVSRKRNRHPVR